jgi:hypothetical protein
MSDTYYFSDVLKCVYQLKKITDKSFDLADVQTGMDLSILTSEFDKYGFAEIPEEDLGMILLQVAGEGGTNFENIFMKVASLIDEGDFSTAGHWTRELFKWEERIGMKSPTGLRSKYITKGRLAKIMAHVKAEQEEAEEKKEAEKALKKAEAKKNKTGPRWMRL